MRGPDVTQEGLFVMRTTADYVPAGHPLVAIREILNHALGEMDALFESIYEDRGRYSVPPEWLLRGLVLQALYGTHGSTTDPEARLAAKSDKAESIPAYMGHVLMDNRGKLAVDTRLTIASGTAEREAAIDMLGSLPGDQGHPARGAQHLRVHDQDGQTGRT